MTVVIRLEETTVNPYAPPDVERVMTSESRPRRGVSLVRMLICVISAVCIAFVLVQLWGWTAQFHWSSDLWLMAIPPALILTGLFSMGALVVLCLKRKADPLERCAAPETPDNI